MQRNLLKTLCFALLLSASFQAEAQVISDQPVVYSQTVIAIVPGSKVPKTLDQSPLLQSPPQEAEIADDAAANEAEEGTEESPAAEGEAEDAESDVQDDAEAQAEASGTTESIKDMLAKQPLPPTITFRVQVRPDQIPLDSGIFTNYKLDANNAVLTYYAEASPKVIHAESVQKSLDILFVRDDGVIAQIIPEVVPAYLTEEIEVTFPLRALLYVEAGLTETLGITPGYRIEHGMFRPKPLIYTAPEAGKAQIIP